MLPRRVPAQARGSPLTPPIVSAGLDRSQEKAGKLLIACWRPGAPRSREAAPGTDLAPLLSLCLHRAARSLPVRRQDYDLGSRLPRAGPCCTRAPGGRLIFLGKEVIQPQVLLRLPCYDFTPVINTGLDACFPCGLAQRLLPISTPMV